MVNTPDEFTQEDFQRKSRHAVETATRILCDPQTPKNLVDYYDPDGGYVGASFANLQPNVDDAITATDLLAVTMMAIEFPNYAVRKLVDNDERQKRFKELLNALPQCTLEYATDDDIRGPMAELYDEVKKTAATAGVKNSNRWVTASKIVARKRPCLFPVRDRVVCAVLGIQNNGDRVKDWFIYREIMRDAHVKELLTELPDKITQAAKGGGLEKSDRTVKPDKIPLRLLDAALWFHGKPKSGNGADSHSAANLAALGERDPAATAAPRNRGHSA